MTMKTKNIVIILAMVFLLNGCAVKNEDSLGVKTAKHVVNSPLYVIMGVGVATTLAIQGTLIGGAKILGVESKEESQIK